MNAMGEVSVVVIDCSGNVADSPRNDSFNNSIKSFDSLRVLSFTSNSTRDLAIEIEPPLIWPGREHNLQDAWLPITESRNGSKFSAVFHIFCSGFGFQALLLPLAFATLGWTWGIICLSVAFVWQLFTIWLLVNLHESSDGARYSRYLHLSITAFGAKLGKLLAIFPVMYLSGGSCVMLIITGGGMMQLFYKSLCGDANTCNPKSLSGTEWFLIFTVVAISLAQFPNLNSVAKISLVGSITAITYCSIVWILSVAKDRLEDVSYHPLEAEKSGMERFGTILNGVGIIVFCFRGHNVILEIQGTLPSSPKHPAHKTMWAGVKISYLQVALCLFPVAISGFWAYGNQVPIGGVLSAVSQFHGQDTSKYLLCLIYLLAIIHSLSTFQIYSMVVFDNLEMRYTAKKQQPCPRWLRTFIRLFFGGFVFFVAVGFPFLAKLAPLLGGMTMPLTYVYPCFMWLAIKKPSRSSLMWWINFGLGCLGICLSVVLVVAAIWNLADKGLKANFFNP